MQLDRLDHGVRVGKHRNLLCFRRDLPDGPHRGRGRSLARATRSVGGTIILAVGLQPAYTHCSHTSHTVAARRRCPDRSVSSKISIWLRHEGPVTGSATSPSQRGCAACARWPG
jgi:hypothetical protein